MKIIILEDIVYKVSDKDYKLIRSKQEEIFSKDYYHAQALDMNDFLESIKDRFKEVGVIYFDFRL